MVYSCIDMITYLCIHVASTNICCSYVQYIYIYTHCIFVFMCIWYLCIYFIEGSFEVKLLTKWTDEKQSRAEAERRKRLEERRVEEKESEGRRCRCAKR